MWGSSMGISEEAQREVEQREPDYLPLDYENREQDEASSRWEGLAKNVMTGTKHMTTSDP
jgi:hypothetical protein